MKQCGFDFGASKIRCLFRAGFAFFCPLRIRLEVVNHTFVKTYPKPGRTVLPQALNNVRLKE